MTITPLHKRWLKIWPGTPAGEDRERWFVEICHADGCWCVGDYATEAEARAEAAEWGMPIIRV